MYHSFLKIIRQTLYYFCKFQVISVTSVSFSFFNKKVQTNLSMSVVHDFVKASTSRRAVTVSS